MSVLPIRALALAVALARCTAAPPPDGMADSTEQGTHLHTALTSGFTAPEQLVLRDPPAWQAAWTRLHEGAAPPLPAVDFARDMVVLLALGERSSGGYQIRFDALERRGADATVQYTVTTPGPGCMTTRAITSPVDVVRVPRVAGSVRFAARTVRTPC